MLRVEDEACVDGGGAAAAPAAVEVLVIVEVDIFDIECGARLRRWKRVESQERSSFGETTASWLFI